MLAKLLRLTEIYWNKPGFKAAFFISAGICYAKIPFIPLPFDLIILIILLSLLLFNMFYPKLSHLETFIYGLLLVLTISMNSKIRMADEYFAAAAELAKRQKIEATAVVRKIIKRSDNKVTVLAAGENINYQGKNRRIKNFLQIYFAEPIPFLEYGARIKTRGNIAGLIAGKDHSPERLLIAEAQLLDAQNSIYNNYKNHIYQLKDYLRKTFAEFIPAPADKMALALLLGERNGLSTSIVEKFRETGLSHILAISGLHLGILLGFFYFFLKRLLLPKKYTLYIALIMMTIYVYLVNFQASIIRASMMAGLVFLAVLLARSIDLVNILGATVSIIGLIEPAALNNVGMQLSVGATFFIVATLPPLNKIIFTQYYFTRLEKWFINSLLVSLSAWLGIMPLTAWYFQEINGMSIIASLLVVPLAGVLLFLGFCLMFMGGLDHFTADILGKLFAITTIFMLRLIDFLARSNILRFNAAAPSFIFMSLYYLAALIFFCWLEDKAAKVKVISIPA